MSIQYNAVLYWYTNSSCNFSCEYCIARELINLNAGGRIVRNIARMMRWPLVIYDNTVSHIRLEPLLSSFAKSNKIFLIIFSGGEPFLVSDFVEICRRVTEKNYIGVVSNLVSPRVVKFADAVTPAMVNYFIASLHITELERTKSTKKYIEQFFSSSI